MMKEVGLCAATQNWGRSAEGFVAHVGCGSCLILAHFRLPRGLMKTEMRQKKT
jgi:hypothetical protein